MPTPFERIALAAVAASATLSGLAHLGAWFWGFDTFSHFAPFYLVIGTVGVVWTTFVGRVLKGVVGSLAGATLIGSGALILPELGREIGPSVPEHITHRLKVIHLKEPTSVADPVVFWLNAERPDFVMVTNAPHSLRDRLQSLGWRVAGSRGEMMIFSRESYLRMNRPKPEYPIWFVNATYQSPSGHLEAVVTHLGWPIDPIVEPQIAGLRRVVRELPRERMILAGDFNATPWSVRLRALDRDLGLIRRTRAIPTWPATVFGHAWPWPLLPIDHVYAGPGWATVEARRGPSLGLAHYPVVVTLAAVSP